MKLEGNHKKSAYNWKCMLTSEICGCFYCLNTFSANAIEEWCGNTATADEPDYCKCCNEQIRHDGEALALLKFVAKGEQTITHNPLSFEDVEFFVRNLKLECFRMMAKSLN
ncbi:MAG: hypothetical protein CMI12_11325 [Oceanospirillum sp.]|jgi:hypothetical protein|nr:hypothetical protein [Oceanospirillum sp.]|tara:strand:+ start:1886 stop:2218 length:333 start_codon:yes stop_codon:yes gene_type:complete